MDLVTFFKENPKTAFQPQFELEDARRIADYACLATRGIIGDIPKPNGIETIVVATSGTSAEYIRSKISFPDCICLKM